MVCVLTVGRKQKVELIDCFPVNTTHLYNVGSTSKTLGRRSENVIGPTDSRTGRGVHDHLKDIFF